MHTSIYSNPQSQKTLNPLFLGNQIFQTWAALIFYRIAPCIYSKIQKNIFIHSCVVIGRQASLHRIIAWQVELVSISSVQGWIQITDYRFIGGEPPPFDTLKNRTSTYDMKLTFYWQYDQPFQFSTKEFISRLQYAVGKRK